VSSGCRYLQTNWFGFSVVEAPSTSAVLTIAVPKYPAAQALAEGSISSQMILLQINVFMFFLVNFHSSNIAKQAQ